MTTLSADDWSEIYNALDTKLIRIETGFYREDVSGENAAWVAHLNKIKRKIGPEGYNAALKGVRATI